MFYLLIIFLLLIKTDGKIHRAALEYNVDELESFFGRNGCIEGLYCNQYFQNYDIFLSIEINAKRNIDLILFGGKLVYCVLTL